MKLLTRKNITSLFLTLGTIMLSLGIVLVPTDTLIEIVGTENAYVFMYAIALVGSISTFASIPYPLILIGLVSGGVHPLFAGLASALGVITSDTVTFFAATRGRAFLPDGLQNSFQRLSKRIEKYPGLLTPGLFLYGSLSPLSNDFAVISLSFMKCSYWKIIVPLAFGNIAYNLVIAFLGIYAYNWLTHFLQ